MSTETKTEARERMNDETKTCSECAGRTVLFRGHGGGTQYWICPKVREPGHLSAREIEERILLARTTIKPSGRFA